MKTNKIVAASFMAIVVASFTTTGCSDTDLYEVDSPDWLQTKIDSIAAVNAQNQGDDEIEGLLEDVYTIGATDYSSGWWADFTKYYVIPEGETWTAKFNLNINPDATNTYKNFAMIITNDEDRGATNYKEYGAIRYDNQPSGNSEWGDYIDRSLVESTLTFSSDTESGVTKLGGTVVLTVDRSNGGLVVTMTNGTVTKTYNQTATLANLNADESNTNIRCFLCVEGSYIDFLGTTIEPIGGCTSADDKQPVSMVLNNVPSVIPNAEGLTIDTIVKSVTATVTFEEGVTKEVEASELIFSSIPDITGVGKYTLVAMYSTTFKGEATSTPIMATANFEIVAFSTVEIDPFTTYYSEAVYADGIKYTIPKSLLTVNGVDSEGNKTAFTADLISQIVLDETELTPAEGTVTVKGNWNGIETSVDITFKKATEVTNTLAGNVGTDLTTAWWTAFSADVALIEGQYTQATFTNYAGANNWSNFLVILRAIENSPEYAVVRADNYGWATGYEGNTDLVLSGGQADWATWLTAMSGSTVTVTVANNGKTADVHCEMIGTDGNTYIQWYHNIHITPSDFEFAFTVDGSYLEFK